MLLRKREKILFIVTGFCLAIFVIDRFYLPSVLKKWRKADEALIAARGEFLRATALLQNAEKIEEEYAQFMSRLKKNSGAGSFISRLSEAATRSGIRFSGAREKKRTSYGEFVGTGYDIQFNSSTRELVDFLYELEHSQLLLEVSQITITSKPNPEEGLTVSVRISGLTMEGEGAPVASH